MLVTSRLPLFDRLYRVDHHQDIHERIVSTSPPLQSTDVSGYFGQVFAELMTTALELPDDRPRELVRVQRQVRERHHLVVATVIQEHRQLRRELRREVFSHRVLVHLPLLGAPEGRRDEEQPRNGLRRLFFAEVLQQDRAAQRMPHEEYFPVQRGELYRDPVPPCPVLGTILIRHLRAPHVVGDVQSTT